MLVLTTLFAGIAGRVRQQTRNETTASALSVTYTYCVACKGTSYLTVILTNVATSNVVNVNLEAEGFANHTTRKRGYTDSLKRADSTLYQERTPFMIKMSPVTLRGTNATISTSPSSKSTVSTKVSFLIGQYARSKFAAKEYSLRYQIGTRI